MINLQALNRFLPKEKFKMEGLHTARSLLRKGDYNETGPQGQQYYYAVPIHPEEISSFQVQGNNLRVLLPPIWPLPSSPSLHQDPLFDCCPTAFRRDMNSHLLGRSSPDSSSEGCIFTTYQMQMTQLIKAPTRITSRSKTLIDHIYTTDTDKVITSGVSCSMFYQRSFTYIFNSLIFSIHRSRKQRSPSKTIHYRNFKNYSPEQF